MIDTKARDEYRKLMDAQKKMASDRLAKNAAYNKAHPKEKK
jgi:hypothetical protein